MKVYDVIIVGAGHAGIEAALASARMGRSTLCVTLRKDRIGHLPCNCSIGGPAKGHIAREVDALGGQMGVTTDYTMTHIRRVGTGRGPAVQTLRAHVCKSLYPRFMQRVFAESANLDVIEGLVDSVLSDGAGVSGVILTPTGNQTPIRVATRSVVLTTGTFLNGLCHEGSKQTVAARQGDQAVQGLGDFLRDLGVSLRRFKTGTTPRIRFSSIEWEGVSALGSEPDAGPFSFLHDHSYPEQPLLPCWQTHTNEATHELLRSHLHESAMFSGQIQGVGPRYCPSVEDKIVRFADKLSHPIFLEKEEWEGESTYVQGFSTSMPAEVQLEALRTIPGLQNVDMMRPGYAVEYDMADPLQLHPTLMSKLLPGLFLAGQINGTSGYEEAAGQGIVAGINAARYSIGESDVLFSRDQSFIGVMIDDLVTKGVEDPYRMLTARAEHRLLLRNDNADQRLTPLSRSVGLCSERRWLRYSQKMDSILGLTAELEQIFVNSNDSQIWEESGTTPIKTKTSLLDLLRRSEIGFPQLQQGAGFITERGLISDRLLVEVQEQIKLSAIYDGYIQIQSRLVDQARKLDDIRIPKDFDYSHLRGLSYESLEKLSRHRPMTAGQASRLAGVRPSDVALLVGFLRVPANASS